MKKLCLSCGRGYYSGLQRPGTRPYDVNAFCSLKCQKEGDYKKAHVIELPLGDTRAEKKQDFGIGSEWLLEHAKKPGGVACPICRAHVQIYVNTISQNQARTLLLLYRHFYKYPESKPVHVDSFISIWGKERPRGNKHGLLCLWGLLERTEGKIKKGAKVNGYYKITDLGKRFVRGEALVQKYALVYRGELFEFRGPEIGIGEALAEAFDYQKFMSQEV